MSEHLSDSALGKATIYPQSYNADILYPIVRKENRDIYQIDTHHLPFVGWDVWNAYEVSFLTDNHLPVSGILKLRYNADNEYIVESKSLKLYLNGFNLEPMGKNPKTAEKNFLDVIKKDLENVLKTEVFVRFFNHSKLILIPFEQYSYPQLTNLIDSELLEQLQFSAFHESPDLLKGNSTDKNRIYKFQSDLLRSNCPVTNQPDWGDLFCYMESKMEPDWTSIMAYLISFRKENHFHEEIAEMIFKRFYDQYQPEKLMIATMYTRRGGIDINPIRSTHAHLIDIAFTDMDHLMGKTDRQ